MAQIVLIILSITTCTHSFQIYPDYLDSLRYLADRDLQGTTPAYKFNKTQMNEFCTKANITGYAKIILDATNSTVNEQTKAATAAFNYDPTKNKDSEKLIAYLKDNKNQKLLEDYLVQRVTPLVIFIIFAFIALITWIIYFFCCCCPCCCCSPKGCCCQSDTCPNVAYVISIICFTAIIATCIAGFVYSADFTNSTNSVTCQFMNFYYNTESGQDKSLTPRWIGITGIKKTLDDTNAAIDKISTNSKTAFNNSTWTTTEPQKFKNNLTNIYNKFSARTLLNTNPAATLRKVATVKPIYIEKLGDYETKDTSLNLIYQEFNLKISASIDMVSQAQGYSKDIDKYSGPIKDSLSSVSKSLSPIEEAFAKINNDVIKPWVDVQNTINKDGVNAFLAIFGFITSLSCFCIIFMTMYACCCKIQCFRFCLHFYWFILGLLTVVFFILGVIFGIIGLVGKDGVNVIEYVFSNDNLSLNPPYILGNAQAGQYLNICLNGNGDLAKEILGDQLQGSTGTLEKLYNVSNTLIATKKTISANKNSIAIESVNSNLNNLKINIDDTVSPSYGSDSMKSQFAEYNKWMDYNNEVNYQRGCSSNTKDNWTTEQSKCQSGYVISTPGTASNGDPNCLLFNQWSNTQAASRYSTRPEGCSTTTGSPDFNNVGTAGGAYHSSFTTFSAANTALINELQTETNGLNNGFLSMSSKLIDLLNSLDGIIVPLVNIFNQYVGDAGIFQLVNCKYMGTDMRGLLDVLKNVMSTSAQKTYGAVISSAIFLYFGIMCMFIVILRKKIQPDDGKNPQNQPDLGDVEMGAKQN